MKSYITYRNGAKDLGEHVKAAVTHFYQTVGKLPLSVTVNPEVKDDAKCAVLALDLGSVPVITCGGCLSGEVWLQVPKGVDLSEIRRVGV